MGAKLGHDNCAFPRWTLQNGGVLFGFGLFDLSWMDSITKKLWSVRMEEDFAHSFSYLRGRLSEFKINASCLK